MVTLYKGMELTKEELNVYILDSVNGQYYSPAYITYSIYRVHRNNNTCCEELILETLNSVPIPFGIGKFFAPWNMPKDIEIGAYRIKWNIKKFDDSEMIEEPEEFEIVSAVDAQIKACIAGANNGVSTNVAHIQFKGGCAEAGG